MENGWLDNPFMTVIDINSNHQRSRQIIIISISNLPHNIRGVITKFIGPKGDQYIVIMPNLSKSHPQDYASLLGLAMVDMRIDALNPTLMPQRLATAFYDENRSFRHQLFKTFPHCVKTKRGQTYTLTRYLIKMKALRIRD